MRTILAIVAMVVALALGALAAGLFGWAAWTGAILTADRNTRYDLLALLLLALAAAVGAGASWLWRTGHALAWPGRDPAEDFAWLVMVVWWGGGALIALCVALRVTGVI